MIDLRSDTVTRPSKSMLEVMFTTKVGDDVLGDDPTVNDLEEYISDLFGVEEAVFCPSGTMANQIALKAHTRPGDEVICSVDSHIYNYEGGGIALNSGCSVRLLNGNRGRFTANDVLCNINNRDDEHLAYSKVVAIENSSNRGGGSCYDFEELERIGKVCESENLSYHLDGARIFNALVESDQTAKQYGALFDSISVCLSKGLGAPVGSVLLGNRDFIRYARRFRKAFGGGMRQSGYLAAAGLYALKNNIERLKDDHKRAKSLEKCLLSLPYVKSVLPVSTNIIIFTLKDSLESTKFLIEMESKGIHMIGFGRQKVRAVTHLDITDNDISVIIETLEKFGN